MSQQAPPHKMQTKERARKNQIVVYFSPQRRRSCQLLGLRQRSGATVDESEGAKEEEKVVVLVCYNCRRCSSMLEDGVYRQHIWRNVRFSRSPGLEGRRLLNLDCSSGLLVVLLSWLLMFH